MRVSLSEGPGQLSARATKRTPSRRAVTWHARALMPPLTLIHSFLLASISGSWADAHPEVRIATAIPQPVETCRRMKSLPEAVRGHQLAPFGSKLGRRYPNLEKEAKPVPPERSMRG